MFVAESHLEIALGQARCLWNINAFRPSITVTWVARRQPRIGVMTIDVSGAPGQLRHGDTTSGSWATGTGQRPRYIGGNERSTELVTSISK